MSAARIRRALLALTGILAVVGWLVGAIAWPSVWTQLWPVFLGLGIGVVLITYQAIKDIAQWVWNG